MRTAEAIAAIERQRDILAEGLEDTSSLWTYLYFLDDLAKGFLAYRTLSGSLAALDEILDHDTVVVGVREHGGVLVSHVHGEGPTQEAAVQAFHARLIELLPGSDVFPEDALKLLPYCGREVVAAITVSRESSPHPAITLFYLPQFEDAIIFAALKGALSA